MKITKTENGSLQEYPLCKYADDERPVGQCYDCGLPYGHAGWVEAVVPDEVWEKINPTYHSGCGLLCINCISARCVAAGLTDVPVMLAGTSPLAPASVMRLAIRAAREIKANAHKGDFESWVPSPEDLHAELCHHADKYLAACDAGDLDEVAEHLGDLFNYIRKGWELWEQAKRDAFDVEIAAKARS